NAANGDMAADVITFAPALTAGGPAKISLSNALPNISTDMTIQGPGAKLLTVERSSDLMTPRFRIFTIAAGTTVNISGMTITKGFTADGPPGASGASGGGIDNSGTLTLTGVSVSGNKTGNGGDSPLEGGSGGSGGGISNNGTLNLINSTVSGN